MKASLTVIFCTLLALASSNVMASTFRCGSKLVSLGDRATTVIRLCGKPVSRENVGYTSGFYNRDEQPIEEWLYGPKGGMYYYLRFVGGELVKISTER